jgi:hypothetical protein
MGVTELSEVLRSKLDLLATNSSEIHLDGTILVGFFFWFFFLTSIMQ